MEVRQDLTGTVRRRQSTQVTAPRDGMGGGCGLGDERQGLGRRLGSASGVDALGVEVLEDLPDDGRVGDQGEDEQVLWQW